MSEHGTKHRWDHARSRCLDCGRDAEEIADELREEIGWLKNWMETTQQALDEQVKWNAQARSLLVLFSADEAEPVFALSEEQHDGYECLRCDTYSYDYKPDHFPHAPECPWLRARALLDKETTNGE